MLSFWLTHAFGLLVGSALVAAVAPTLHRALRLSEASRRYWIGAWLLALLPAPLAACLSLWAPASLPAALPTLAPLGGFAPAVIATAHEAAPVAVAQRLELVLVLIYLAGVALLLLRACLAHRRLWNVLRDAHRIDARELPGTITRDLSEELRDAGIELLALDARVTAFASRWPRPRIVLPRALLAQLQDDALAGVLRHEAAHLARRDPQWTLLLGTVNALLWFDPFLRRLARRVRLAAELACDAEALAPYGARKNMRRVYAETYLETLRMSMDRTLPCPAIAFSPQDLRSHRMRIAHIVHGDPRARKRPLLALALGTLALVAGGGFTMVQASSAGSDATPVSFAGPIIAGRISSPYGVLRPNLSALAHNGVDLTAARGTRVLAPAAGTVQVATEHYAKAPKYGTVIVLDHGQGWQTVYAHLDGVDVAVGDRVAQGQQIGRVGSTGVATGPHVHVEVHRDGERVDPASVIGTLVAAK